MELAIAVLVLIAPWLGLGAVLALLAIYSWEVRRLPPDQPCNCFGRSPAPVAADALASVLGGSATGFLIAGAAVMARELSTLTASVVAVTAVLTAAAAGALQWRGRLRPLLERRGQVPRRWLLWRRRTLTAAAFGLVVGSGALVDDTVTRIDPRTNRAVETIRVGAGPQDIAVGAGAVWVANSQERTVTRIRP